MDLIISYDSANDEYWRVRFYDLFEFDHNLRTMREALPSEPEDGAEYVRQIVNTQVFGPDSILIALIGAKSHSLARLDWDFAAALTLKSGRPTPIVPLRLSTHPDHGKRTINPGRMPKRLLDNMRSEYLHLWDWTESLQKLQSHIKTASKAAREISGQATNKRELMKRNLY
ncbi:MAG: hypothetical protein OEW39_05435 [Deltaproteobacteria bacterium]|nr:hypothetical protein [Deltaproteobacteria bacterium]